MSQTLKDFVSEIQKNIIMFEDDYIWEYKKDPEAYPLEMVDGQEGLWTEFFLIYLKDGII